MLPEWRQLQIVNGARALLVQLALAPNSLVLFDIDDTLITPHGLPYKEVVEFYNECKHMGIHVGLCTARIGDARVVETTIKQLNQVGVSGWSVAYFRKPKQHDVALYKKHARQNCWDRGYHVVMTVGDQDWDHGDNGGFSLFIR